nr:hypothetical protein [uncultured Ruegeria sp.]
MPNVTQNGSLKKNVRPDESQIHDRFVELSEFTRSKGYVHTARMIEEALNAYAFERRHLGIATTYLSELQKQKGVELSRSEEETDRKQHSVPNFRSARSKKPIGVDFKKTERSVGPAQTTETGHAAFVLTARMRTDGSNAAQTRKGFRKNKLMPLPAEPEFLFR